MSNLGELVNKFSDNLCEAFVYCNNGLFTVKGTIHFGFKEGTIVEYRAADPIELRQSISGSGLPFPNPEIAFGDINSGTVKPDEYGDFQFKILSPNSYYKNDDILNGIGHSKILVQPILYLNVVLSNGSKKRYELDIGSATNVRSLTNFPTKPVRSTGRNTPSFFY